jgi:DNA polymerase elongation subunit (family B)
MAIQTAVGWILDVTHDHGTNYINLLIKLEDSKTINFKQKPQEHLFYILPKSYEASQDLYQQLSRNDHLIKRIVWDKKYIDLQDKIKTSLIGLSLDNNDRQRFIQKLGHDTRVKSAYNIDISHIMQFIFIQLKIAPTSKVKIEYDDNAEQLLSIAKIDGSQELTLPSFSVMCIEALNETSINKNESLKLSVTTNGQASTTLSVNSLSDPVLVSYISQNNPDIIVLCGDYDFNYKDFTNLLNQKVIIRTHNTMSDFDLVEEVEKSRFSYLPLRVASRYGMMRLIDSRITFELLQREFVIPARIKTVSKHHEQIRTLEDIFMNDKAGMIISPEIGLHANVAVLDFNDEYANIIIRNNISYENLSRDDFAENKHTAILPSIVQELVSRRVCLKQLLKTQQPDSILYSYCESRLNILKQILVCLYGTSGSIWNRFSNVQVFESISKLSREILLKTQDIVQRAGFELIYGDTDAVFLKRKNATRNDFEIIMNELIKETGLETTLEFHYKFLVLLYIEADEKMEARKHYFGLTYDNQLVTRGIDTRRHDSPIFIKEFQSTLLSKLFDCQSSEEVLTIGYENALRYITQSIDKLMNGEVQITDLVISKLLRQNIEKYRSLFPHVAAAIRLNISGVITSRGDNIQYVHTDASHADPLYRITPARLISSKNYDKERYLEMLLDSAEAVLSVFGFNRSLFGFDIKKNHHWWNEIYQQRERDIQSAKTDL